MAAERAEREEPRLPVITRLVRREAGMVDDMVREAAKTHRWIVFGRNKLLKSLRRTNAVIIENTFVLYWYCPDWFRTKYRKTKYVIAKYRTQNIESKTLKSQISKSQNIEAAEYRVTKYRKDKISKNKISKWHEIERQNI